MSAALAVRYRFDRFEMQPNERRLLDAGVPLAIKPRAFDLLAVLVERAGHLVTKDELLARVWPRVIVEEAALQMQVSALRKLLGRDAIVTVSGSGYRFALAVARVDAERAPAPAAPPHNLPQPLTSFIGRETQLAELKALLGRTRLLTLLGSGGCGKTRLALQLATDLNGAYRDGVWLVELASLSDPALVPQVLAQVFGLKEQRGRQLTQTVAEHVAQRHLLMVLDNAEHVLEACAQLAEALLRACARLSVIVTSRERLGIVGELIYRVPPLSAPDPERKLTPQEVSSCESARLFIDRAQLQQPRFTVTADNVAAVASICLRLDGIPLAIELAAGRLGLMPVSEVSRRLDQRFSLLTGGSRTALPRQQTLRALIDWSYDLLSGAEQALLCRASVFSGGWTLRAAEQVCAGGAVDAGQMLQLLTSLAEKSLVLVKEHQGSVRYALLETVRYYARDRLAERGEEAALTRRHFDHLLRMAQEAEAGQRGEAQALWLDRIEAEHDNLRAALAWGCSTGAKPGDALALAVALGWFWRSRGHLGEGRYWLAELIGAGPDGQDRSTRADALLWAGTLATDQADYAAARALQEEALWIVREVGNRQGIVRVQNRLGILAAEQGDHAAARSLFEDSMGIVRELDDPQGLSMTLTNLGVVTQLLGELAAARALFEEALAIERSLGNQATIAMLTNNVGQTLYMQGDHRGALPLIQEALAIWNAQGSRFRLAFSLEDFGCLAWLQGQPARAARLWGRSERLGAEIGFAKSPVAHALSDGYIAAARTAMGDAAFESAWAQGRALDLDALIRELLGT